MYQVHTRILCTTIYDLTVVAKLHVLLVSYYSSISYRYSGVPVDSFYYAQCSSEKGSPSAIVGLLFKIKSTQSDKPVTLKLVTLGLKLQYLTHRRIILQKKGLLPVHVHVHVVLASTGTYAL